MSSIVTFNSGVSEFYYLIPDRFQNKKIHGIKICVTEKANEHICKFFTSNSPLIARALKERKTINFVEPTFKGAWGLDSCCISKKKNNIVEHTFSFDAKWSLIREMLNIMFLLLSIIEDDYLVNSQYKQLMIIESLGVTSGLSHSYISGSVSSIFKNSSDFLFERGNKNHQEVLKNMQYVYSEYSSERNKSSFRFSVDNGGQFGLSVPGDCCCLSIPYDELGELKDVSRFASHNVDGITQQFSLLIGLATMWEIVRNNYLLKV